MVRLHSRTAVRRAKRAPNGLAYTSRAVSRLVGVIAVTRIRACGYAAANAETSGCAARVPPIETEWIRISTGRARQDRGSSLLRDPFRYTRPAVAGLTSPAAATR